MSLLIILLAPLLLGVWVYLWRKLVAPRVAVALVVSSGSVPHGMHTDLTVRLMNPARLPAPYVACSFALPDGLRLVPPGHPEEDSPRVRTCRVAVGLRARQETDATFRVYGHQRGRQVIAKFSLTLADGLTSREVTVVQESSTYVVVHPRLLPESRAIPLATRRFGTSAMRRKLYATSLDWINIRTYQAGDAFRDIAWPLTARRGELIVLERAPSIERRVVFLLNAQINETHWRHDPGPVNRIFEEALTAAIEMMREYTHLTVHTNAVWRGRTQRQRYPAVEFVGVAKGQIARQLGHWLGDLSTYAETGFVPVLERVRTTLTQASEVVVFTAYDDAQIQYAYARLRRQGHRVTVVNVSVDPVAAPGKEGEAL